MTMGETDQHIKLLVEYEDGDESVGIESLWTRPVDGGYEIDNIPFYAKSLAVGDIVTATPDSDGLLKLNRVVKESGHSTVRLWFSDAKDVAEVRAELKARGCPSEVDIERLVAVDVPPGVPYREIRQYLDEREGEGLFEYQEACLAQKP